MYHATNPLPTPTLTSEIGNVVESKYSVDILQKLHSKPYSVPCNQPVAYATLAV